MVSRLLQTKGLGALAKDFAVLNDPTMQHTHDIVVNSRNYMYAHTDLQEMVAVDPTMGTKESIYKLVLDIRDEPSPFGVTRIFGRGIIEPKLRSVVIPDVKALSVEQKRRFKGASGRIHRKAFDPPTSEARKAHIGSWPATVVADVAKRALFVK